MVPTGLYWCDLEWVVVDAILNDYANLQHDSVKKRYCEHLKLAEQHRLQDYHLPRKGESYALWYHLLRVDNIATAILSVHDLIRAKSLRYSLKLTARVLDIGSGTGAGVMAVSFIYSRLHRSGTVNIDFTLVEPNRPMRDVANSILPLYKKLFQQKSSAAATFDWKYVDAVNCIRNCAASSFGERFDLMLFSHTFDVYKDDRRWAETKRDVIRIARQHLAAGGIMLFLTPQKPEKKLIQIDDLTSDLLQAGFEHHSVPVPSRRKKCYSTYASPGSTDRDLKHSQMLIDTRRWIAKEGSRLGVDDVFKTAREDPRPYYWCNCRIDVIAKPL